MIGFRTSGIMLRLLGSFILVGVLAVAVGAAGLVGLTTLDSNLHTISAVNVPNITYLLRTKADLADAIRYTRAAVIAPTSSLSGANAAKATVARNQAWSDWQTYWALPWLGKADLALAAKINPLFKQWLPLDAEVGQLGVQHTAASNAAGGRISIGPEARVAIPITNDLDTLIAMNEQAVTSSDLSADQAFSSAKAELLVVILLAAALAAALGMVLTRSLAVEQHAQDQLEQQREQNLAEVRQALAERELHAALIDQAHDALIVRDPNGFILRWNHGAAALYGWTSDEVKGRTTHDLLQTKILTSRAGAPSSSGTGADSDADLFAGDVFEGELEHTLRDGTRIIVETRQVLLRNEAGSALAILEINRDVTARKHAEAERDWLLDDERAAREAAERAVKVRDEFLSTAAHELKTPLTGLRGFAQILLRRAEHGTLDRERSVAALEGIESETHRLTQLITRLLDVARIETGRLILEPTTTDISRLCQEAVASAKASDNGTHPMTLETPGALCAVVDEVRVAQVLRNLLDNAVKFSPAGGPIAISVAAPDAGTVRIAVRDHGLGVPEQHRDLIFERLGQAHAESYRSGLGLGLYISKQIVQLHGGQITAQFPHDGGSLFTVTLPRNSGEESTCDS